MARNVTTGGVRDVHPMQEDSEDDVFFQDTQSLSKSRGFARNLQQPDPVRSTVRETHADQQQTYFAVHPRNLLLEDDDQHKNGSSFPSQTAHLSDKHNNVSVESGTSAQTKRPMLQERQHSIVDGLLFEIYDRWHGSRTDSFDSDTFTECSSTSEVFHSRWETYEAALAQRHSGQLNRTYLETQSLDQLRKMVADLQRSIAQVSARLVRQLKRRDRRHAKLCRNCDIVTAILQAASLKRQIDTRMKFSIEPPPGQSAFDQWKDAMKAVNRLPMGIPTDFRRKVWLSLADHYIRQLKIDWQKTVRFAFNERSNPDDDKLGMQIVKDLHRTGCSSFSGQDNEEDRAVLKRVLLAYARWNKRVGYCQGFNVIAALLLNVMERKEDDALKVMIYLIDHVLPESYFDNNLRALSVDMAVFRDLLRLTLPTLSRHLDRLQHAAQDVTTGACYEPPLTNVFTMQWFLTIFANGLPKEVVLRVWDALLLEGSEVLLRTALCIWGKLARRIMKVGSADEFYSLMGELSSDMMQGTIFNGDDIVKAIYSLAPFPFSQITELRERYTYNIRPFSSAPAQGKRPSRMAKAVLYSDEDDLDDEELRDIANFSGMDPLPGDKGKGMEGALTGADISLVGPGAYGAEVDIPMGSRDAVYMERMSTDITALKMQYEKLKQRQKQAHIIIAAASAKKKVQVKQKASAMAMVPKIESPTAMNHLFLGKAMSGGRNRLVTDGPRIAVANPRNSLLTKQLQAVAAAQAASRARGSRSPVDGPPPVFSPFHKTSESTSSPSQQMSDRDEEEAGGASADSVESPQHMAGRHVDRRSSGDVDRLEALQQSSTTEGAEGASEQCSASPEGLSADSKNIARHSADITTNQGGHSDVKEDARSFRQDSKTSEDNLALSVYTASESSVFGDDDPDSEAGEAQLSLDINRKSGMLRCLSLDKTDSSGSDSDQALSCNSSEAPSPERKVQRPVSIQLSLYEEDGAGTSDSRGTSNQRQREKTKNAWQESASSGDLTQLNPNHHTTTMTRSMSAPYGCGSQSPTRGSQTPTPTHSHDTPRFSSPTDAQCAPHSNNRKNSSNSANTPTSTTSQNLCSPSRPAPLSSPVKINKPFNPFPVKHVNTNRAKTGLKLGLYTPSTLEHIQGQLLGGLSARKARNASS